MSSRTPPQYLFQLGEPIVIGRRLLSGDAAGVTVSAVLKRTMGQGMPRPDAAVVAEFTPSFVAEAGDVKAHWLLTIDAATALQLGAGQYVTQAVFSIAGEVVDVTPPAFIAIQPGIGS